MKRKYLIELLRFDAVRKAYEKVVLQISMTEAVRAYNAALKSGDYTKRIEACAVLNLVRQQAGMTVPAC